MENTSVVQTPSPDQNPIPPSPPKKYFKLIIGSILILGVFISGGLFLGKTIYSPQDLTSKNIISPTVIPLLTPTPDPTANWKTYTNSKYGFTIKVPPDMGQGPSDPRAMVFSTLENAERISPVSDIYVGYGLLPTVEFISCATDQSAYDELNRSLSVGNAGGLTKITKMIVDRNISGLKDISSSGTIYWFSFCQNNHEFEVKFTFANQIPEQTLQQMSLVDQILSTFRFLNPTAYTSLAPADSQNSLLSDEIVSIFDLRAYPERYLGNKVKVKGILTLIETPRCLFCNVGGEPSWFTSLHKLPQEEFTPELQNLIRSKNVQQNDNRIQDSILLCQKKISTLADACIGICKSNIDCGNLKPTQINIVEGLFMKSDSDYYLVVD